MAVSTHVKIPNSELNKFYILIQSHGFNLKDFHCPQYGQMVQDADIISSVVMIGFKFIPNLNYKFQFSHLGAKYHNPKSGICAGSLYRYFPDMNHGTQLGGGVNYNEIRNAFSNWLKAIKYHEDERKITEELFNGQILNQQVDQELNQEILQVISNRLSTSQSKLMYKYHSNYNFLVETLINSTIHLSLPKDFTDKLDCTYTFDNMNEALLFCENHLTENADIEIKSFLSDLKLKYNGITDDGLYDKLIEFINMQISGSVCIFCVSASEDSKLLWEFHAEKYSGYRIEFDFSISGIDCKKHLREVSYDKEIPIRLSSDRIDYKDLYTNKAKDYIFENEHRVIILNEKDADFIKYKINLNSILSITFGKDAKKESIDRIKTLIRQNPELTHIKLYQQEVGVRGYLYSQVV